MHFLSDIFLVFFFAGEFFYLQVGKAGLNSPLDTQMAQSDYVSNNPPLKAVLRSSKDGLYMLVLLASPRWRWCPGEYFLVSNSMVFCIEPENIHPDTSATWEKLIKPTYRAHILTKYIRL